MQNIQDKLKALKGYINKEGKFDRYPGKRQKKKQSYMLEILSTKFEKGIIYTELEVNAILNMHHSFNDPASLRRFMFGSGLLDRTLDGKEYRLIEQS